MTLPPGSQLVEERSEWLYGPTRVPTGQLEASTGSVTVDIRDGDEAVAAVQCVDALGRRSPWVYSDGFQFDSREPGLMSPQVVARVVCPGSVPPLHLQRTPLHDPLTAVCLRLLLV